jgi:nitrogen fixation protein FixH
MKRGTMKRGAWWPIAITLVLATTVGANVWVAMIASDDPSFAIEPKYYAKAIAWDSTMVQARENARLGWRLTPAIEMAERGGSASVRARLTDAAGNPLTGAVVRVSALHVARANDVHEMTLAPGADGEYSAPLGATRPGQWELRFDVRARGDHYTDVARQDARLAR